jgi:hypothetical protein
MSDYQMLLALMDEYKAELKKRKDGEEIRVWNCEKKDYETQKFRPANKARLQRLRIEISALMLKMERKMAASSSLYYKEGWE